MEFIFVMIGGAIGSILRYLLGKILPLKFLIWSVFPLGTFGVNLLGSFLIGLFSCLIIQKGLGNEWRVFVIVGILGGFTTFSSFSLDAFMMINQKEYFKAIFYILSTNILGLLFLGIGWVLAKSFFH
ncbi:fluoride efflux transporter CrcB [Helicobacter sp. 11S03491-1]|uniref:fluoride efflux transporter CrcB n=1 Tax=Helicobacter sp. 11S03491-1 TaxID=1476196 RepID=UPI0015DB6113|nr:fluoride efflux transporter CrcB [Helicobacter sp. 11S03491-1]